MQITKFFNHAKASWILLGMYFIWGLLFKLVTLTILTFFLMSPQFKLYDISEAFSNNELNVLGFCAAGFLGALLLFKPMERKFILSAVFPADELKNDFTKGLLKGTLLAMSFVAAMIISGYYHYLGYFIHSEETLLVVLVLLIKIFSLSAFVIVEEYLFRKKLLSGLQKQINPLAACVIVSLFYVLIKYFQFSSHPLELLSFFIISIVLSLRYLNNKSYLNGAGLYLSILIVFHPLLGLPLLNNEFSGMFLVKYHMSDFFLSRDVTPETAKFITGGENGPFSSLAFQVLFLIEGVRHLVKRKFNR